MQTAVAVQPQVTGPKLPAPLWHLLFVVVYLLVPVQWWPWASNLGAALRGAGRIPTYFLELEFQWLFLALVCTGVFLRKGRIRDLMGTMWTRSIEFFRDSGIGLLFMIVNIIVIFAMATVFPVRSSGHDQFLPRSFIEFLAYAPVAITAGLGEEIIFRGYLQKQFHSMTGSMGVAVLLQAIVFALAHGYRQEWLGAVDKLAIGIALGVLANSRKSLLPGIMAHSFIDLFVGFFSASL